MGEGIDVTISTGIRDGVTSKTEFRGKDVGDGTCAALEVCVDVDGFVGVEDGVAKGGDRLIKRVAVMVGDVVVGACEEQAQNNIIIENTKTIPNKYL